MDLNARCRGLMLAVAGLDDAGLPVEHKRVIAIAKKLRRELAKQHDDAKPVSELTKARALLGMPFPDPEADAKE